MRQITYVCALLLLCACAPLRAAEKAPCPPTDLASIDARFVSEAISTCKAEGSGADTCKALPGIRAKYTAERARWTECVQ